MNDKKVNITIEAKDKTARELAKSRSEFDKTAKSAQKANRIMAAKELLGVKPAKKTKPVNQRLWRRFRQIEKLPPKEKRQLLSVIDTFLDRDRLAQRGG